MTTLLVQRISIWPGAPATAWQRAVVMVLDDSINVPPEPIQLTDGRQTVRCRRAGYEHVNRDDRRTEAEKLRDIVWTSAANQVEIELEPSWQANLPCLLTSEPFAPMRAVAQIQLAFRCLAQLPHIIADNASWDARVPPKIPGLMKLERQVVFAARAMGPEVGLWLPFSFADGRGALHLACKFDDGRFSADVFATHALAEGTAIERRCSWAVDGSSGHAQLALGFIRAIEVDLEIGRTQRAVGSRA